MESLPFGFLEPAENQFLKTFVPEKPNTIAIEQEKYKIFEQGPNDEEEKLCFLS